MDKATLVRSDLETRGQIQTALSLARIPVTLIEVDYIPQLEEWQIFVATPLYDTKGPAEAVSRVLKALQDLGVYKDIPIRRLFVKSPRDPEVKALEAEVKAQSEGTIHIVALNPGHKAPYSVVFAPFSGPGGAVPSRRFGDREQLRQFLEDEVGLSRSFVEEALREIHSKGTASVFHVQLTRREARRLQLA